MTFEYQEVKTCTAQIDIDDPNNCALISRDIIGQERYLVIITELGETQVLQYGPIIPGCEQLPNSVSYFYNRYDANDFKTIKAIKKFVAEADYVELSDFDAIRPCLRNFADCIISYGEEEVEEGENDI